MFSRSFLLEVCPLAVGWGWNPVLLKACFLLIALWLWAYWVLAPSPVHHSRAWNSVIQLQCLTGVRGTATQGIWLDIPWWCQSKSWVNGCWDMSRGCSISSPFGSGLWTEDKELCQNLLSGSETDQFSCLLKLCFSWHGPLGSKEKEMLWNMKVIEGSTLFIFLTSS